LNSPSICLRRLAAWASSRMTRSQGFASMRIDKLFSVLAVSRLMSNISLFKAAARSSTLSTRSSGQTSVLCPSSRGAMMPPFSRNSPCHCLTMLAGKRRSALVTPLPASNLRKMHMASIVFPIPTSSQSKRPPGQAVAVSDTTHFWCGHRLTIAVSSQARSPCSK